MTAFVKIENGVVVQKQPYAEDGFVEAPDDVVCGMVVDGAGFATPAIDPAQIKADLIERYSAAVQSHVDKTAAGRGYGSGVLLASYATSTVPAWKADAKTFVPWRDAVWLHVYSEMAKIEAGEQPLPSSIEEFIADLPAITWPE